MGKRRFLISLAVFCLFTNAIAKSGDNPFEKVATVAIESDGAWVIDDKTATRSGSDSDTYYHLSYDRKQLRLRLTEGAEDSEANAKKYDQFAINDVLLDGKRLPVFQWCLSNQERHSRFLQEGLKVKKDVCMNQGDVGAFTMILNVATLNALKTGKQLTFELKPFRSEVNVNFDISDFSEVVDKLNSDVVVPAVSVVAESGTGVVSVGAQQETCKASPPVGFSEIKAIEYDCASAEAKTKATSDVDAAVSQERESRQQVAAEREKKRLASEKVAQEKLAAETAAKEKLAAEEAALAASIATQKAIDDEITNKMLGVCQKKWEKGEHRCYCEKYIEYAPKEIQDSSTCAGN